MLRMLFGNNADREVNVDQVAEAISNGSHTVVDVRELGEWRDAHIESTIHIPLNELLKRVHELPADKPVYALCHSGLRSLYAVNASESAGRQDSKSLAGGIIAWSRAGKTLVR